MAVIRGGHPRMAEANFYGHFNKIKIKFIGDKKTGWIIDNKIPPHIEFINSPLKPAWLIDPVTLILGPLHTHRAWKYLEKLENNLQDVDIINISDLFYFYCGQAANLAKKLNKKLVATVWETVSNHPSTYLPPYSFNVKAVLNTADLFIARSQKAVEYLRSLGVQNKKIRLVYKGISTEDFYPASKQSADQKIRILYVGQLVESKGVRVLLDTFIKLCQEFDNLELWICARANGEPLGKKVKRLKKNYPIKLFEAVPYDKLPSIYHQCQIYCQLSQDWKYLGLLPGGNEWFSYSIIEAMASGLPVVATNVGGIPEQLGEENILINQKDINSTYLGLKELIQNPLKRSAIGQKNVNRVKSLFNIKKQAHLTEQAILKGLYG